MDSNSVIYIKAPGQPPVPVTVRVEWLPSGAIKPLFYWMPDNTCYEIKHTYKPEQLAFLKDRGEGIRYKIIAELKASEYENARCTQHEAYLYLADNRFCEKGFIDERYGHGNKKYIQVTLDIFNDGDYELVYFTVGDKRFMVEKTMEIKHHGSLFAGGIGIRHKVDARLVNADNDEDPNPYKSIRRPAALFWELNKWFVAVNNAA